MDDDRDYVKEAFEDNKRRIAAERQRHHDVMTPLLARDSELLGLLARQESMKTPEPIVVKGVSI